MNSSLYNRFTTALPRRTNRLFRVNRKEAEGPDSSGDTPAAGETTGYTHPNPGAMYDHS
ncbi:MAG TPA: hypothetical protein PK167_02215 [Prolixibacteraceae bacterium]|nr:hypothetical protein [Prolixibacteraceae bacterium]